MPFNIQHTENSDVARIALAWAIVEKSWGGASTSDSIEKHQDQLTEQYIKVYNAILANEQGKQKPYQLDFGGKPE